MDSIFLIFIQLLVSAVCLTVPRVLRSLISLDNETDVERVPSGIGWCFPDPCELTFANTLLLSNAAISLGNAFISF